VPSHSVPLLRRLPPKEGAIKYFNGFTFSTPACNSNNLNPVVIYENVETQKDQILNENKGKCGVYRLTNLTNKKTYSLPPAPLKGWGGGTNLRGGIFFYIIKTQTRRGD
jgi:hypothetical protein